MSATTCLTRRFCQYSVTVALPDEGGSTAHFDVVGECADLAGLVWDALDTYGLSGNEYTLVGHAEPTHSHPCCGVRMVDFCAC